MEKKFECLNCGHRFLANDKGDVRCPYCQSDNVSPIKETSPVMKYVLPSIVGLVIAAMTFGGVRIFRNSLLSDNNQEITSTYEDNNMGGSGGGSITQENREESGSIPNSVESITVNWTGPQLTGTSYSLDVTSSIPAGQVEYILSNFDKKFTSADGHFRNIPATETGVYTLIACNTATGAKSEEKIISGFVEVKPNIQKMSTDELQRLVDNKDNSLVGAGANPSISPSVKLTFVNLQSGEKAPQVFTDIFGKIRKELWLSVTVQSVSYDSQNRISSVSFRITYPED